MVLMDWRGAGRRFFEAVLEGLSFLCHQWRRVPSATPTVARWAEVPIEEERARVEPRERLRHPCAR